MALYPQKLSYLSRISTETAFLSFACGSILLGLYELLENSENILILGLLYVLLAFIANSVVFLSLLFDFLMLPRRRNDLAVKALILLANIPVAVLYFFIVIRRIPFEF